MDTRPVDAQEAYAMGLANRIAPRGGALDGALELAAQLSAIGQWSLDWDAAMLVEVDVGLATLRSGEAREGAARFVAGQGRGGAFWNFPPPFPLVLGEERAWRGGS